MPDHEPGEALRAAATLANALESLGVAWLIGGSLASSFHGVPRATQDVDFVADLDVGHGAPLAAALGADHYVDETAMGSAIRRRGSFNLVHLPTMLKLDVFVARRDPLSRSELERRQRVHVEELEGPLWIASAEDTVLQKLAWYREGGAVSRRQWDDALGVLALGRDRMDLEYLRRWAPHLGVEDLLARALEEAGLEPPGGG